MKNYFVGFLLLVSTASLLSSCRDESKLPAPQLSASLPLITPVVSADPEKNHFDYVRARISDNGLATNPSITNRTRPVFEFSFEVENTRNKKVKTVEVYKSFSRSSGVFGTRVLHAAYSSFPVTVSVNSQDALNGLQRVITPTTGLPYLLDVKGAGPSINNPILINDAIVFTFEYILDDDTRIILTPVTKTTVGAPPGGTVPANPVVDVLAASAQVNAPLAMYAYIR